jgi:4-alpha-glucanotransferase
MPPEPNDESGRPVASQRQPAAKGSRIAGVTIPLFSIRSHRDWGIGEIGDLPAFAGWVKAAGGALVQLLPLGEISGGDTSPYAALSAFGIDPMYLSLGAVADLDEATVAGALGAEGQAALERARQSAHVDYPLVRRLKARALRAAHRRFRERELDRATERARAFQRFCAEESGWLADLALFRAIKDRRGGAGWSDWPEVLARREPAAVAAAHALLEEDVSFHAYAQWLAFGQWAEARAAVERLGMEIMGDLPFMVGRDSADVWSNQAQFRVRASVGTPPDVFDPKGQDWDLPPYDWAAMSGDGFRWLRRRARHAASLYHRFRIDHVVGFYRTFQRPRGGPGADGALPPGVFDPAEEAAQLAHGEAVMGAMIEAANELGARLVAEDLGTVPDFVRASLTRLGVPGYRVLVWEKDDTVFRDPRAYPPLSVACFGTHDTPPIRAWWEELSAAERAAVAAILPGDAAALAGTAAFEPTVHRALLEALAGSGSELVLLLAQDVLAHRERINVPGTVGAENWTYRLPLPVEELPEAGAAPSARTGSADAARSVSATCARVRAALLAHGRAQ